METFYILSQAKYIKRSSQWTIKKILASNKVMANRVLLHVRCSKEIGHAHSAVRQSPNSRLNQMEPARSIAAIVIVTAEATARVAHEDDSS